MNLYPDGQFTGAICKTRESALDRCTYTGDKPDAEQVEVRIVPIRPNNPSETTAEKAPAKQDGR